MQSDIVAQGHGFSGADDFRSDPLPLSRRRVGVLHSTRIRERNHLCIGIHSDQWSSIVRDVILKWLSLPVFVYASLQFIPHFGHFLSFGDSGAAGSSGRTTPLVPARSSAAAAIPTQFIRIRSCNGRRDNGGR